MKFFTLFGRVIQFRCDIRCECEILIAVDKTAKSDTCYQHYKSAANINATNATNNIDKHILVSINDQKSYFTQRRTGFWI